MNKIADKRLGIELASMRHSIWRRKGEKIGETDADDLPAIGEATDIVYWVDTDVMIADCLTKLMNPEKLIEAIETNYWDLRQPIASLQKKRHKQQQRRKKVEKHSDDEVAGDEPA